VRPLLQSASMFPRDGESAQGKIKGGPIHALAKFPAIEGPASQSNKKRTVVWNHNQKKTCKVTKTGGTKKETVPTTQREKKAHVAKK